MTSALTGGVLDPSTLVSTFGLLGLLAAVFDRPGAKRLGPDQLARARSFFDTYGARTVILARFIPVIRTVAPVMAGASEMRYRTFFFYNIIGALAWGMGVPLLGYLLGGMPFARHHIELILIGVVVVSVLPIALNYLRGLLSRRTEASL